MGELLLQQITHTLRVQLQEQRLQLTSFVSNSVGWIRLVVSISLQHETLHRLQNSWTTKTYVGAKNGLYMSSSDSSLLQKLQDFLHR
jgi:isoprenylcysteine carboxyl methyltransferase (ICMT) family protein YpbQ